MSHLAVGIPPEVPTNAAIAQRLVLGLAKAEMPVRVWLAALQGGFYPPFLFLSTYLSL